VAFLAEYDALPQVGHGCGHNLIGTGAAGAALGVAAVMGDLPGTIQVIGTPAEEFTEGLAGKIRLLDQGVLSGVDVCLMFHPWTETAVAKRDFGFMVFEVSFRGQAAHAAADPHHGLNALDAVVLTYNSISALRQQVKPDARIHCIITHGGDAVNIIPHETSARIMFRSTEPNDLEALAARIEACIQGAALSTGTEAEVQKLTHVQPSRFNATLCSIVEGNMNALGIDLRSIELWGASSDFGNVSQEIPALSMLVKTHEPGVNWHSKAVAEGAVTRLAHAGMLLAAKALALSAIALLTDADLLASVRKDFVECQPS
jgi:amidohydrolase